MCRVAYPKAADSGKSDAVWKVAEPGLKITTTPINPIVTAAHLLGPTNSFKNITEKIVISKGLIKNIATPSAKGKAANPKKNVICLFNDRG